METQETRALFAPGDTVAVYGLWLAPVPKRLEKAFARPYCVWLAVDTAKLKEDGTPGNLRPLPLWAPPTSWPVSEFDQAILALVMPFYQEHSRLISSSHARGVPVEDKVLGKVLAKLRTTPFLYGEARRPIEIRPDRPVRQLALTPWADPVLTEDDGSPLASGALLLGQDPCWVFVAGAFRPVEGAAAGPEEGGDGGAPAAITLLEETETKVHAALPPRPRLTLHEEGDRLVAKLSLVYGTALPIAPTDPRRFVPGELEGEWGTWPRDPAAETRIVERLVRTHLEARTNGVYLGSGDHALDFLLDDIPGLLVEGWEIFGEERLRAMRVTRREPRVNVSVSSGIDWFEVKSEVTLDGGILDEYALREALRGRSKYVKLGTGQYARLPADWLARQRNLAASLGHDAQGADGSLVQRLPGYLALAAEDLLEAADEKAVDPRWEAFRDLLTGEVPHREIPVPEGFVGELRPYQRKGLDFMVFVRENGLHGILADDMGLGKTIQAIALILHEKEEGRLGPSLLVVPTSVIYNWEQELKRFAPGLRTLVLHGPGRRHAMPLIPRTDVVITSYTLLRRDLPTLRAQPWYFLLLDEAQNIKNPHSQSARAARSLQSRHRFCLTGTPLENHPLELWSLFQFLMPGLLGSERVFRADFMGGEALTDATKWEKLRRRSMPFILRRLKQEVATDLPPRSEMVAYCEFGPEQRRLYNQTLLLVRSGVFEAVDRDGVGRSHLHILEALLRLRQICCAPELILPPGTPEIPSSKVETFMELVAQVVEEGHRVLVFSQFVKVLHILQRRLVEEGIETEYLDGQTKDRLERVERFNAGTTPVFLISLKAGGTGLNLTGADYVIHFDPWWNPAVEDQATDRAHRIGQTRHVFSYKLIAKDTIEEKVVQLQDRKRKMVQGVLEGEVFAKKLTREDIEFLFAPT
ncbi:MAG: SNF2 helicase associated domain-containing protein [Candidatus Sericytochromatia bacterium]|nr:SNF2 helicase associated domain-containing protein [Candidatus Tanganyikabacteria bacterium]